MATNPVVFVDTTAFYNNLLLNSGGWPHLIARARRSELTLATHEVNVSETIRHATKNFSERKSETRRLLGKLTKLGIDTTSLAAPKVSNDLLNKIKGAEKDYPQNLRSRLDFSGFVVLPNGSVLTDRLLEKDLTDKKPFSNGKGMRDAIWWLSLADYFKTNTELESLFLVTANSKDFCKEGHLHSDLRKDIPQEVDVRVFPSVELLNLFLEELFEEDDRGREDREAYQQLETSGDLAIQETLNGISQNSHYFSGLPITNYQLSELGFSDLTIEEIEIEGDFDYQVIDSSPEDSAYISATAEASVVLDGFVQKSDYCILDEDAVTITVNDGDWNDHAMWVTVQAQADLMLTILRVGLDVEGLEIDTLEFLKLNRDTH